MSHVRWTLRRLINVDVSYDDEVNESGVGQCEVRKLPAWRGFYLCYVRRRLIHDDVILVHGDVIVLHCDVIHKQRTE